VLTGRASIFWYRSSKGEQMPDTFDTFIIVGFGVAALCPILLAIRTLQRMQTKRLYPILRINRPGKDGESLIVGEKCAQSRSGCGNP
jgi:hypothetical protein